VSAALRDAAMPFEREGRGPYIPVFLTLLDKGLTDSELGLFIRILKAAYTRRGSVCLVKHFSLACALRDAMGGDLRAMKRDLPKLLELEMVAEGVDARGQRVLQVPSWQEWRSRPTTARERADDAPTTAQRRADDAPTTSRKKEACDSEELAAPSDPLKYKGNEESKEGESDPRAHARVASPMPTASPPEVEDFPEPEDSGVFLRADAPPAAPAPVEAPPEDQPITRFSTALGGELAAALGSGIAEVTTKPWVPQSRHATGQKLLAMAKLYPEMLGLGRKEFLGRWRALGVGFARWADRQAEKKQITGFPLFLLEDFLSGEGAKHLQRPAVERPKLVKAASSPPPPKDTPITPEEREGILNMRRVLGFPDLPGFGGVATASGGGAR